MTVRRDVMANKNNAHKEDWVSKETQILKEWIASGILPLSDEVLMYYSNNASFEAYDNSFYWDPNDKIKD